jgi:hypothetical protein
MLLARMVSTYENTRVTLPVARPVVSDSCRVHELCAVCIPPTDLHATDDADVHTVVSLTLPPTPERPLQTASPEPLPSRVTLIPPVRAAFETPGLLGAGPSNVNTSDTLPTTNPPVITLWRAHTMPEAVLHASELSDVHSVVSPMLLPTPAQPL